jgi:hypothetical protein
VSRSRGRDLVANGQLVLIQDADAGAGLIKGDGHADRHAHPIRAATKAHSAALIIPLATVSGAGVAPQSP